DKLLQRQQSLRTERAMIGIQLRALKDADAPTVQDELALSLEAHGATSGQGTGGGGSQPLTTAADTNTAAGEEGQTASTSEGESEQTAVPRFSGLGQTSHWEQMEFAISQLQALYDKRLDTYKPEHPVMVKLRTNIHQAKESIKFQSELARRRLQARYNALKIQQEALSDVTQGWAGPQQDLTIAEASEYRDLQQEVERLGKLVSSIAHRIIDVSAQSGESLITRMVAEPAGIGQVWPKPMIVVPASFAGAFGVGVGLAFLLFFFDSKFTDIMAIEQKLGLPFIGGIPRWQRVLHDYDPEETIIMDKDEPNAVSEAYRSLRISLDGYLEDKKGYALLVTSADPGEGKSATVANLGVAFSWSERRVLLVDADLRRPNLHNVLGQKNSDHGLTQILMGEVADWRESLRHTDYENVDFIPAGKFVYEASELCSRERLGSLLDSWGQEYDIVILDSAPIGRIVDTAMVAKSCDGALLMALHGKASFPAMRHALRRLEGTNVLGFCLNAIEMPRGHGHYYRGYSGYMRYGMYSYYQYYSQALYGYGYDYYGPDESDEEGTEEEDEHGNGESLEGVKDE
ncbi:MAG: polysaccharide biosynthesis tyrosine autokinase, partial [Candidatus Pacebacteria bacterium]|nr:polysaccharide biosynthesis tyrosine autokinase [Candidatus Paceibacterota bacterium]